MIYDFRISAKKLRDEHMTDDLKNTINGNCPKWRPDWYGGGKCALNDEPCLNVYDCYKMRPESIIERRRKLEASF